MAYIKIYSQLTPQELRQHDFREEYKRLNPSWDDSLVLLSRLSRGYLEKKKNVQVRVLDAGCGHGNFVIDELRPIIKEAIGVDLNAENTSKNKCLDKIIYCPLENLPFKKNSFDMVVSLWAIEHLKNPQKAFEEIYRVLKPGGLFAFVTPNRRYYLILLKRLIPTRSLLYLLKRFYGRERKDWFLTFYRANTFRDLGRFLEKTGFKPKILQLNSDPSYLALDRFLFNIAVFLEKIARVFKIEEMIKPHIVGVVVK